METSAVAIRDLFSRIAPVYDFFNHFFTLGIDCYWRRRLVGKVLRTKPQTILDLATGSGDVALLFQKNGVDVIGADFCLPLLLRASTKGVHRLTAADAANLPFPDNSFDAVTIAFGFRNFIDRTTALAELHRVIKTGGNLHILEFSHPHRFIRGTYFWYLGKIMPSIVKLFCGQKVSDSKSAYLHLFSSVELFPDQEAFSQMLREAKFQNVSYVNLTLGIAAIHSSEK